MPCVAEVVNRSLKADCTDFNLVDSVEIVTPYDWEVSFVNIEIKQSSNITYQNQLKNL